MIPSKHGLVVLGRVPYPGEITGSQSLPMGAKGYGHGTVFMPKVQVGRRSIVLASSANFVESELEEHTSDVLFMCVPGHKYRPEYAARLPALLKPKLIIPFHYDNFFTPLDPSMPTRRLPRLGMSAFREAVRRSAAGAEIREIGPYQAVDC